MENSADCSIVWQWLLIYKRRLIRSGEGHSELLPLRKEAIMKTIYQMKCCRD